MTVFFDLLNFYELSESRETLPTEEIAEITAIDPDSINACKKIVKNIRSLKKLIQKNPENEIIFFRDSLCLSKKNLDLCCFVIEITQPGLIKKKHLELFGRNSVLDNIKIDTAIGIAAPFFQHDHEIATELGLPIDVVKKKRNRLPTVSGSDVPTFEIYKKENYVREFFAIYPYSTIAEASRALKMNHKEVRVIVEDLTKHGEIIKYNNMPRPIEYENKKLEIIDMKLKQPGMTDKEISLALCISLGQVRQSIEDTRRIWQMEMASSHEFYIKYALNLLDEVEKEAIDKAKKSSSSRWLELRLMSIGKKIDILGLKAPEKHEITEKITINKKQRDLALAAYLATDSIDAEFENIEITGGNL